MAKRFEKLISGLLISVLTFQPVLLNAQDIVRSGPASGPRPHVDQSANGTTVLNISTPNGAGVSHDIYTAFTSENLILNNASTNVSTQLGGWIEGNPNLVSGGAGLWIGEVVGGNQTQLNGILEVGGQTMDVVLANEFGITCNGCGFVNTGRATLTTGKPIFAASGALQGFDVRQGLVTVGAAGLNPETLLSSSDTSRVDVIARAAVLYGAMRGTELNLITGANRVDYDWSYDAQTGAVTGVTEQEGTGAAPVLAVDVAALGGMYANAIRLIATEDGVGVRLSGELASSTDIALRADGRLTLGAPSGGKVPQIRAKERVIVRNRGPLLLEGAITSESGNLIDIRTTDGATLFTGQASGGAITLEGAGLVSISGAIDATQAFRAKSLGAGLTVDDTAEIAAATVNLAAATDVVINGKLTATGGLSVFSAGDLVTGTNSELFAVDVNLAGGFVTTAGDATAAQGLTVSAQSGGAVNSGSLVGANIAITSAGAIRNDGKIAAGDTIQMAAAALLATEQGSETFGKAVTLSGSTVSLSGVVKANDGLGVTSTTGDLTVDGTLIAQTNSLQSAANLRNLGMISGSVTVDLTATDALTLTTGSVVAGPNVDLAGASLAADGRVVATKLLSLNAGAGGFSSDGVLIGENTTVTSTGDALVRGSITGTKTLTIAAAKALTLTAASALHGDAIALSGLGITAQGIAAADLTLSVVAGTDGLLNAGTMSGPAITVTSAGTIGNTGIIAAGDVLALNAATALTNAATLISGNDLTIYADQIINNGGVIWANDSITLAANAALDPAGLVQNTAGRIEAFQGDLVIHADDVINLGTAPTMGPSQIIKWLEEGNATPFEPISELAGLIDPMFLDANGVILPAYEAAYVALWADVINGGTSLSAASQGLLRADVRTPSGTSLQSEQAGRWGALKAKANAAGIIDPAAHMASLVDPAYLDANGNILPAYADAYAALWVGLASGDTSVSASVKAIINPSKLVIASETTDPLTGVTTTLYSNDLKPEATDVWAAMLTGSAAAYDIVNILYQDRFNNDGRLAEFVAGGKIEIEANTVSNIFGNFSAGEDILITAADVTNKALGASQLLLEVHKKPSCFTCHEGKVDFYDTFGGRIEAVGNVYIAGNLTNVTVNSSELSRQGVMDQMNTFIAAQAAQGDADLTGVPAVTTKNFHLVDQRNDAYTAPVAGNGTDIREITAADTGSSTVVATGGGTPAIVPIVPGAFAPTGTPVAAVDPTLTPTDSLQALLVAGLNTIAETNLEFTEYSNYITSNYMMDVDRLEYRDELVVNTFDSLFAGLTKTDVIAAPSALPWLNKPIRVPAPDGSGMRTIHPAASNFELNTQGALITGRNVILSGGTVNNSGAIKAANTVAVTANTITGAGGSFTADAGEVALTALGKIELSNTVIDAHSIDIIAGQDFVGKGVTISAATDASIFAIAGVTLTALEKEYSLKRGGPSPTTVSGTDQQLSSLTVGGNLSIITSADLVLAGLQGDIGGDTLLSAGGDLKLEQVASEYEFHTGNAKNGTDIQSRTSHVTDLTTGGDFTATSGGSAFLIGTQIDAGGSVELAAAGGVALAAAQDLYAYEKRKTKKRFLSKKKSTHSIAETTHLGVNIAAAGDVDIIATSGDLLAEGASFVSNNGDVNLTAVTGDIYAGAYTDVFEEEVKKSSSVLFGLISSSSNLSTKDQFSTGTEAVAASDLTLVSGDNTTLVGATLMSGGNLNINTRNDFSVEAAIDSQKSDFFSQNMGLVTITTIQERSFVQNAVFTQLLAGQALNLTVGGKTSLTLYDQAGVDAPAKSDLYPEELLALAGLELLTKDLANDYFYDEKTQLSPAFKALVSIALSIYAPNIGVNLLKSLGVSTATAAGGVTALGAGANAFASSFVVGSLDGVVSGNFDLAKILEGAAFSGFSAGLTAGINLDFPTGHPFHGNLISGFGSGQFTMAGLLEAGLDGVLSSGLSSAVYGTDFGDGVLPSIVTYIANGVAGAGIEEVADKYGHTSHDIQKLVAKALINCAAAEAKGASCASGAIGTLVTDFMVEYSAESGAKFGAHSPEEYRQRIEIISAIAGYFTSGGKGENVNATVSAALMDFDNNAGPALVVWWLVVALTAADYVLTAKDAYDMAQDGLACDGGEQAACDRLADASRQFVIETGVTMSVGQIVPGDKIGMKIIAALRKGGDEDVVKAVDEAIEAANGSGKVVEGEVGTYADLAQRSVRDGMTPDHIPSFAAVKESLRRNGIDVDSLSDDDLRALRGNTNCVVVKTCDHQAFSRTYGGRNNSNQIQVDAQDLRRAADADLDTWEPIWRQNGWSETEIAVARQQVHEYNLKTFADWGIDYGSN